MDATSPIALKRFLAPRPAARSGEHCELCREAVAEEHQHVVSVDTRGAPLRLPRVLSALHPRGGGPGPVPGGAAALRGRAGLPPHGEPVGDPPDPGRHRVLLLQLPARAHGGLLPGPGRRNGIAAAPGHVGRAEARQPAPRHSRRRRRGPARVQAPRRLRVPPRPHRRLLRAGGADAPALERVQRRRGGLARDRGFLSDGARPGRPWRARGDAAHFRGGGRARGAVRSRTDPAFEAPDHGGDGGAGSRHRAPVPDPDRAPPTAVRRQRGGRPARALRRARAVGRDAPGPSSGRRCR